MIRGRKPFSLRLPSGGTLELGTRTAVMGIINVTPDSFADGGRCLDPSQASEVARQLEGEGADLLDIGGESTRPGAAPLSVDEECARVLPALTQVASAVRVPVSIDTYKSEVARRALQLGASIVNDISALRYDPDLASVVAESGVPVVLMHTRGRSSDMYREARYDDVGAEVAAELRGAVDAAVAAGVSPDQIIVDPGLGFAKRADHTFASLAGLGTLAELDRPILVGPSRKSFLKEAVGDVPPQDREWATVAAVTAAVLLGAHIVRVHGVGPMRQAVDVADRLRVA